MSRRQTMRGAIFRVAAAVLVLCHASVAAVEEVKFADLDPKAAGQVVLFYRKGAEASDAAVAALAEAELLVKASAGAKAADVVFKQCNAAQKENMVGMEAKGLTSLPMIFVGVEGQGTDRYMRNMTADQIAEYIDIKLEETTEDDVFPFNAQLVTDEFPVMVKFHETWCSRCNHMKSAFEFAASKTVGRVMFMEVECSSSVDSQKFCGKHRVDGFPTLVLMGGSLKKPLIHDGDRSAPGIMSFIQSIVPDALEPVE
mmetsp:Transcript_57338/g.92762  ORF Transcript_57338/g.92762 Transcript_57338/m.92762 type:complete len:256 (+) Transcript_57338:74-841(+)